MTKSKLQIKSKVQMTHPSHKASEGIAKKYDLQERTALFGKNVIRFVQLLPRNEINRPLISQIIRSATSIGANYMEADGAESKKDFRHKIAICKKESKETMHWFQMMAAANEPNKKDYRALWQEAHELTLIFSSIINSVNKSND